MSGKTSSLLEKYQRSKSRRLKSSSSAADRRSKQFQHKTLCLCLCFVGASNPSGNKQKTSVRTHEPPGGGSRPPRSDTLMPTGVPVTESCKRGSKTRRLVSHESAARVLDEYEHGGARHGESPTVSTSLF